MTRAELVTHLRTVLEETPPEIFDDSTAFVRHIERAVEVRFPDVAATTVLEAIEVIRSDDEAAEEDEERERAKVAAMVDMCQRHAIPQDTPMGEALRLMAERGEPAAIALLAEMNSPAYRVREALVDAALKAHPAWYRDGDRWTIADDTAGPVSDDDLVDWFQRTHPHEARAITDRIGGAA